MFWLAMIVPVLWGSTYAAIALYLQDMSPYWLAVWRALPAGLLLLLIVRRSPSLAFHKLLQLGVMNIAIFFVLLLVAAYRLPGAVVGTLGATLPLQIVLIQWLVTKITPSRQSLISAALGLVGVMILLRPNSDVDMIGVAAALLATLMVAISSLNMQRWVISDVAGVAAWQLIIGGALLVPIVWWFTGPPILPTVDMLPGLFWIVVLNTTLAYWLFVKAIRLLGAATFGLISLLNPVTAVILGIVLVGENLELHQFLGIVIIIISLFVNQLRARKV
ncbi:EamA family transporter [Marinomonas epiphytica]